MIQGIFYARFLPQEGSLIRESNQRVSAAQLRKTAATRKLALVSFTCSLAHAQIGTKIVAQSPPGCIVASPSTPNLRPPLFAFEHVQQYIIPRKTFFNRFMTVNSPDNKYSILGFPVSIPHERYHRNEFIFNFGLVIESDVDQIPYEQLVRRLATTFAEMERQNGYLRSEGMVEDGRRPIESLLEIVKEDLNNYGECMIPVDEANILNMKLFPYHPPPPLVKGWHVPIPKMKLPEIVDPTWDLTLQKIIPYVDGVNDVRRIAWLADVSLPLTQIALQHLVYYDTILLLDMFFFGSCYAPRPGIHDFIKNRDRIVEECAGYVCTGVPFRSTRKDERNNGLEHESSDIRDRNVSNYQLIKLMTTFCVGRSVMEWIKLHQDQGFDVLRHIDVRRFVQFGVIKGLLYRVHKYVVSKQYLALLVTGQARPLREDEGKLGAAEAINDPLQRYTDGCHCFDQIITEQNMTDGEIMAKLKSFQAPAQDLTVFYR